MRASLALRGDRTLTEYVAIALPGTAIHAANSGDELAVRRLFLLKKQVSNETVQKDQSTEKSV